jgi:putative ABC transport system permease protein
LTILGIVIGITSVIMVFLAGEGLKSFVMAELNSWGSDWVEVEIKVPSVSQHSTDNASGLTMGINITTLKDEDTEAIKKNSNIVDAYSAVMGQAVITTEMESDILQLWGTTASFLNIDSGKVAEGRFFTDEEDKGLTRVAVLGSEAKEKFFGDQETVGQLIKVGKYNFKVIGVMKKRGASTFMNLDEMVYLPLHSLQKLIMGIDHISFIFGKLKDKTQSEATVEEITSSMRSRHNITDPIKDDFAVTTMEQTMEMINTVLGGVSLLLIAIAAISLIVGGVGIMNIMFVSVKERTQEIGLRKAVGASPANILWQFLWEAIMLTFGGGVVGMFLGISLSFLIFIIAKSQGFNWVFVVKPLSLLISVGVSITIGLIFGLYPARKAAVLDPIEALRKE